LQPAPKEITMNRIGRWLAAMAGLGGALIALATAAPAALATPAPPDTSQPGIAPPHVLHTMVVGGMPGWQIALIAAGAAVFTAVAAVLLDRARAARRGVTAHAM
jgi:hypothetical protein